MQEFKRQIEAGAWDHDETGRQLAAAAGRLDRRYRRVTHILLGVIVICVIAFAVGWLIIRHTQHEVQKGRRAAVGVTCAATSAVTEAGRRVILLQTAGRMDTRFERNLERLGYPPKPKRDAAARLAADLYVHRIALRIEQQSGVKDIVLPNGALDCARVKRLSKTH